MGDIIATNNLGTSLRVFNLFIETAHAVLKDADSHLDKAAGLSAGKFIVLLVLAFSEGTMTAAKLAERTGTKPHNITKLTKRLERDGLVTTERRDIDRRFVYISLTDGGRSVIDQAMPAARETVQRIMASISEPDLAVLERLLSVLKQNAHDGSVK